MFGFMSFADLGSTVAVNIDKVPNAIDMVVGIPRSGMIPAYMIGLYKNLPVIDLPGFIAGETAGHGYRQIAKSPSTVANARSILLVDDSISTGRAIRDAVHSIKASGYAGAITTCAVVAAPQRYEDVDFYFCELAHPRLFEWNAFHHHLVEEACFDLDGVLCADPTAVENDDGPRYEAFLRNARPRFSSTRTIGNIVSARLERYRKPTEKWLADHGVSYRHLHLLDLPTAAERVKLKAHSPHKAKIYRESGAAIFFESEPSQAAEIANLASKPVLCTENMRVYLPGITLHSAPQMIKWHLYTPVGRVRSKVRSFRSALARVKA